MIEYTKKCLTALDEKLKTFPFDHDELCRFGKIHSDSVYFQSNPYVQIEKIMQF